MNNSSNRVYFIITLFCTLFLFSQTNASAKTTFFGKTVNLNEEVKEKLENLYYNYQVVEIDMQAIDKYARQSVGKFSFDLKIGNETYPLNLYLRDHRNPEKNYTTRATTYAGHLGNNDRHIVSLWIDKDRFEGFIHDGENTFSLDPLFNFYQGVNKNYIIFANSFDMKGQDYRCSANIAKSLSNSISDNLENRNNAYDCVRVSVYLGATWTMSNIWGYINGQPANTTLSENISMTYLNHATSWFDLSFNKNMYFYQGAFRFDCPDGWDRFSISNAAINNGDYDLGILITHADVFNDQACYNGNPSEVIGWAASIGGLCETNRGLRVQGTWGVDDCLEFPSNSDMGKLMSHEVSHLFGGIHDNCAGSFDLMCECAVCGWNWGSTTKSIHQATADSKNCVQGSGSCCSEGNIGMINGNFPIALKTALTVFASDNFVGNFLDAEAVYIDHYREIDGMMWTENEKYSKVQNAWEALTNRAKSIGIQSFMRAGKNKVVQTDIDLLNNYLNEVKAITKREDLINAIKHIQNLLPVMLNKNLKDALIAFDSAEEQSNITLAQRNQVETDSGIEICQSSKGSIKVEATIIGESNALQIQLVGINGQIKNTLLNTNVNNGYFNETFDVSNYPSGIYIINVIHRLDDGQQVLVTEKVIIK